VGGRSIDYVGVNDASSGPGRCGCQSDQLGRSWRAAGAEAAAAGSELCAGG